MLASGLFLLGFSTEGYCATVAARSTSQADVQAAINSAASGDTVTVPAGNSTWSSRVDIPDGKKITLQGNGYDSTLISGAGVGINSGARVTGIGFTFSGTTLIEAKGKGWRVDNCSFTNTSSGNAVAVYPNGLNTTVSPAGLIDNCIFNYCKVLTHSMGNFNTASAQWAADLGLGTDDAVYVEDCTFNYDGRGNCVDTNRGGKYVFRYNTVTQSRAEVHSLQSGTERGSRKWEIYENKWIATSALWAPLFVRGGTGVAFNNTFTGPWNSEGIVLDNVRDSTSAGAAGSCDGGSSWDGNTAGQSGWPCRDQIGRSTDQWLWTSGNPYPPQASDPAYMWNNKLNGSDIRVTLRGSHIRDGRDIFINAGPKPGYKPYTYPHPLQNGGGTVPVPVPSAPSSLRIQ